MLTNVQQDMSINMGTEYTRAKKHAQGNANTGMDMNNTLKTLFFKKEKVDTTQQNNRVTARTDMFNTDKKQLQLNNNRTVHATSRQEHMSNNVPHRTKEGQCRMMTLFDRVRENLPG